MTGDTEGDREIRDPEPSETRQSLPSVGAFVMARGLLWKIAAHVPHDDCVEVHLANGTVGPTVLLSPFDRFDPIRSAETFRMVRPRAWLTELLKCAAGRTAGGLRVTTARADVIPYQLAPALAVARGEPRVVLADEVGLGKTIQAGWIVADTMARHVDARVLVAVPAGLRDQWRSELSSHFGIDAVVADARWLRHAFADLPGDVNPWSIPGVYLASIDFIKRADVLRQLAGQVWDAVVVDEAHAAAAPTDRHAALASLARRARIAIAISATPYSGDPRAFESIATLGATPGCDPPLMFRRSRNDVGVRRVRRHRFATVRITAVERSLQRLIAQYTREVWRESRDSADAVRLAMTVLRKRGLSSPWAVLRSLERRLDLLLRGGAIPRQLRLFDDDEPLEDGDDLTVLAVPGLNDPERERRWLETLITAARRAASADSKLRVLRRLVRRLGDDAAIVFTEYRDTLLHLANEFPRAILLHGAMGSADRNEAQRRFNADGGLLLATDAASEGLNLQGRCRFVINYELPWNPVRLEQRIGRVDRIGQRRPVHALTLVARDTAEDLVIARLTRRLLRIAATLGERDRLAAFLDEARTARIVIGDAAADEVPQPAPASSIVRLPTSDPSVHDEASRLSFGQRLGHTRSKSGQVLVSSARCSPHLAEGFVFAFRCSAATDDGTVVDTVTTLVHVHASVEAGRTRAGESRTLAADAVHDHARAARSVVEDRFSHHLLTTRSSLDRMVEARIGRERALRDLGGGHTPLQPGLFDRRAVRLAEQQTDDADAIRREHDRRIALLERSRVVDTHCDLVGVLIVRRDGAT